MTNDRTTSPAAGTPGLATATGPKRRKLWELEEKHHCPLIGTCIPAEELRKIAHRFGFTASAADVFDTHVEAVNWSLSRNPVSEGLQRLLDKRYKLSVDRFAALRTDEAVRQTWKRCLSGGQVAGPLWALYSHKATSAETRDIAFADVHMLSHQVGAGQAADSRRLAELEQEAATLRRTLADERARYQRQLAKRDTALAASAHQLAERDEALAGLADLRRRLEAFESGQIMVDLGRRMTAMQVSHEGLVRAARRATGLDETLAALRTELAAAHKARDAAQAELETLEDFLLTINRSTGTDAAHGGCGACPLGPPHGCVLYVGGRNSLVTQYRQLAERLGVRLLYHDGGLEQGLARLPELIGGADAVLCPTDCVSHVAYYQIKRHCKRTGKPCLFFTGSGVSGFACAMTRLARGEYSLGKSPETAIQPSPVVTDEP
ncbi:DUF2325 domain-containing protein [Cognatazoarcus halotolerans]|uniref:DUF2325 domain-containing protein n=1 Tax=Cognatazoarcus halotolerans TaxID=2686016 RepID=UPI001356B1EB|nr:DUF2325 domain-containing protein [Cognatazoarcus halotolerans]MBX3679714.1 DUF2325 domain-containing protein [Rhodocyclaceae bacterium]MCB1897843.1 DUF2325 domain-containing protein [Rhodocyclaceae bacterium]MCP5311757.1 DUF2325 domain-containing protein [Zoogloeaceae bacterium]